MYPFKINRIMKSVFVLLFCFFTASLAEPGWFSSLLSNTDAIGDDMFAKAHSQAKQYVTGMQEKVKDDGLSLDQNLPTFAAGTIGSYATKMIGSAKVATENAISGVRNTATDLTRSFIAGAANTGMDLLLSEFKLLSSATGVGQRLSLPDIQTSAYSCELQASGGYFSALSSLDKYGPIEVSVLDAESVILEIPMKFNEMQVGYGNFTVKALKYLGISGSFTLNVAKNRLRIRMRLGMDSTCALNIERVHIEELDDITIKFEGLGRYASMITERLTNAIIRYLREVIARQIQDAVDVNLRRALESNAMICSHFIPT